MRSTPLLLALLALPACSVSGRPAASERAPGALRSFDYVTMDGSHFGTRTTLGRPTIVTFIATFDMGSQAVVREIADVFSRSRPRIHAGAVVLEPPQDAPLVETFAATLEIPFPIALADEATLDASGPFGSVRVVPTTVILDSTGAEVWRHEGFVSVTDLERKLASLAR